jgi:uncharacterized protein
LTRLLTLTVLAVLIWLVWRQISRAVTTPPRRRATDSSQRNVKMLPCAHCGLHIPADEALRDGGQVYCSREHLEQGPKR